jgi:ABC-2 type transport system permease protein
LKSLVRPVNPLFHQLADRFCHDGIGHFLVGGILVVTSSRMLNTPWTPANLLFLLIVVISGGAIFIALNLLTCVSAFWLMDSVPVTRFIPYGFASYYSAAYLLGREAGNIAWPRPVVAVVLLFLAYRFWRFGLRHYASTGS